jgi:phosphatidate cytidylyltransferase
MSSNLRTRIIVALIAGPAIIWISYQGGWWLFSMVMLFAVLGMYEYVTNEGYRPNTPGYWSAIIAVIALLAVARAVTVDTPKVSLAWMYFVVAGFFLLSGMAFSIGKRSPAELFASHSRLMWGIVYLGFLYPFVYLLGILMDRQQVLPISGGDALLFLFAILWLGDTAAMGIGSWLGKHKLAPTVSPNKTVEGFIGGLVGGLAIGVLMIFWLFRGVTWYHVLIIAAGCSLFGQLGDLVESMWKRSLGIKDSSAIIPGHGGVLDRFDSLLFAAPFMTLYLVLLTG